MLLLSPSALVQKYGYKEILQPVLDDILTLETTGIEINLGSQEHTFLGTVSIAVADNVAAHALGGFYCNFSTVDRFCRFCNCTRDQLHGMLNLVTFFERTQVGYNNNTTNIETYPKMSSIYGIKQSSCFNSLKYYHVVDDLPPDIAHDIFEGVARDIVILLLALCLRTNYLALILLIVKLHLLSIDELIKRINPSLLKLYLHPILKSKRLPVKCGTLLGCFR